MDEEKERNKLDQKVQEMDSSMSSFRNITTSSQALSKKLKEYSMKLLNDYTESRKLNERVVRLELDLKKEKLKSRGGPITCNARNSCGTCIQDPNCGWCFSEKKCVQGDSFGPLESSCPFFHFSICTESICSGIDNCQACARYPECGWCDSSSTCMEKGQTLCALPSILSVESCPQKFNVEKTLLGFIRKYQSSDSYLFA